MPDRSLVIVMTAEPHTVSDVASINLDQFEPLVAQSVAAARP